jgi:hypothetical protein
MAFLGMRGTGDWATDERPLNWRQGILYLYPNGSAPLTALLSKMAEETTTDPQFHWWTKQLAAQGGTVAGVFTDATLTTPYVTGGIVGATLHVQVAAAVASEFRVGHQVLLRDSADLRVDVNAKVTAVELDGADSRIEVRLLEADNNSPASNLANADTILIIGNINAEGAAIPNAVAYDPIKWFNYTQIFRNPLDITRTARKTTLRTEDSYKEAKRESLELHSIEMEKAFLFGIATENVGTNGKPERTTMGLITAIKQGAPQNVSDFSIDADFAGDTWLASGETWLDTRLEQIFRFGGVEKLAFAGSGALLGINKLAKTTGQIQLRPMDTAYGLKVVEWVTPFGTIYLKTHPLFSYDVTTRNSMVIFEPQELRYRYIDDTMFIPDDGEHGHNRLDGTKEEWLTECGLEYHHPVKFGFLSGFNTDNALP